MSKQRLDGERSGVAREFDATEGEASLRDRVLELLGTDDLEPYAEKRVVMGLEAFDRVEM